MGLTVTFEVNFMDSNMIPWFLSLNNSMISNIFMKFSAIFCISITELLVKGVSALKLLWLLNSPSMGSRTSTVVSGFTPVLPERWGNQKILNNNWVCSAFHFWDSWRKWCKCSHMGGTKLQLEDVFSRVIDILFHSLAPLSSALSAAAWLLQNTNEGTPVSALGLRVLSSVLHWHGFWRRAFNKDNSIAFLVDEWMTPDFGNSSKLLGVRLIDFAKFVAATGF